LKYFKDNVESCRACGIVLLTIHEKGSPMTAADAVEKSTRFSIKNRITLVALSSFTLLLITISLVLFSGFHNMLKQSIMTQQLSLVSETAEQMYGRILLARKQLANTAGTIGRLGLKDPQDTLTRVTSGISPRIIFDAGMALFDTKGRMVGVSMNQTELLGSNFSFRDYVREPLRTGKAYVSAPFSLKVAPHTPMIAIVEPVRDQQGRLLALLAGYHTLGADHFLTSLPKTSRFGSSGYLYILQGRTLLMHPRKERILEVIPEGKNLGIDMAVSGFEGSLELHNSLGQQMLSSFKKIGDTGWVLVSNTPYQEIMTPIRRLLLNTALATFIGLIISLAAIWYVSRRLTQPILELSRHIRNNFTAGNHWQPLNIRTGDEIEQLANTFNTIMQEIQESNQALEEASHVYQVVTQFDNELAYWQNPDGSLRFISANCLELTGHTDAEFYENPSLFDKIIHPEDMPQWIRINSDLNHAENELANGIQATIRLINENGSIYWMQHTSHQVFDNKGQPWGVRGSFNDITDAMLANEKLGQLTRAVEQSPAAIVITDTSGIIEYVNPRFSRITGYSYDEAVGQTPGILKSGKQSKTLYEEMWKTITAGGEWRGELLNRRKDGSLYWEFASISPLFDKENRINGYLAVKEDITERKAIEQELAHSRKDLIIKHSEMQKIFLQVEQGKREWEQTLDNLRDIVILADTGNIIRRCNRMLVEITGKTHQELLGANWQDVIENSGFSFISFDGNKGELNHGSTGRSYDMTLYEINNAGMIDGYVISLNDNTELRNATNELQKAYEELKNAQMQVFQQEKMASIGQLAAGVAHEINNPMGFISSNLSTLHKYIERIAEYMDNADRALAACATEEQSSQLMLTRKALKIDRIMEDAQQLIMESQDGASRVRKIVQDLKSFSRVDQARTGLVDINEALETTINIAWNEIKYVAELKKELGEVPPIRCFPQQLNQVFLNLLVNAAHAIGSSHGTITVKTWSDRSDIYVSVSDTGCGIPADIRTRIFEPFFTTKEVGKGTGLGLSISYEIIKKHNGEIMVESEEGQGTTFTIRLPQEGIAVETITQET